MRRFLFAFLAVGAMLVTSVVGVEAHALPRASDPADGALLPHAPDRVTITFTERPEPRLSAMHVLDAGGRQLEGGSAQPVPGDPLSLMVPLPNLGKGVYTVTWKTVSAVDGHVAGGSFTFGIGVSSISAATHPAGPTTPGPSPLGVAGRWILYVGFALMLGGAWLPLVGRLHAQLMMASGGFGASLIGLGLVAESQRAAAGIPWGTYVSTSLGQNLALQVVPLLAAGVAVGGAWRLRRDGLRIALAFVALFTGLAILTHVLGSHAPSGRLPWLMVAAQWAHLTAFATWIGGLGALLIAVRGAPSEEKTHTVRRFSFVAGIALVVLGVSGLVRGIDEVGAWSSLLSTLFGRLVLVKVALFVALAGLGAVNRYRNVPLVARSLRNLRRVGSTEIGLAAVVIVVAAVLTSLAPPSYSRTSAAAPSRAVAQGSDFGTTVRVRLTATPGFAGPNRFVVAVSDYDTRAPVEADRVSLRFAFPALATVGPSSLELKAAGSGRYAAEGTNLSIAGRWSVVLLVQRGQNSVEVPLGLTTVPPPEQIQITPGPPTLYTIALPGGRSVQTYVVTTGAGIYQVHVTFFDERKRELAVQDGTVVLATPATGSTVSMPVSRLEPGHFVGQGPLAAGAWRFDISAVSQDGASYQFYFQEKIQ